MRITLREVFEVLPGSTRRHSNSFHCIIDQNLINRCFKTMNPFVSECRIRIGFDMMSLRR